MITNILKEIKKNYFISYIYLYIFLMPWNFFNGQMGILTTILLIWWLAISKKNDYFSKLKNIFSFKPLFLLILFFIYAYLSLLWTNNIDFAIEGTLKYYKYYWVMIPILFTSLTTEFAKKGLYIFLISLSIYAFFSILIYLGIININFSTPQNPRGILAYAIVSPYMAIGSLSSIVIMYYSKNKYVKSIFFLFFLFCIVGLFINYGRAGQLAFFMTLLLIITLNRKYLYNIKALSSLSVIFLLSIFLMNNYEKTDRFLNSFNEFKSLENKQFAGSWGQRAYMWYAAFDILKKDPIIGVGVGDNIDEFIAYSKSHPSKATWLRSFHNQHLDILTKYGILGYILFFIPIFLLLWHLKNDLLYFNLAIVFFSITFFDSIGDILLLMKPYNNIFILIFLLFSIIASSEKNRK